MDEAMLEARDLVKHYPVRHGLLRRAVGAVKAVDGVSLTLHSGQTLGIVGESGSGKSTLARVLTGIEAPTGGQVLVNGQDVTRLSRAGRKELHRTVQMVFQDPYTSLNPRMTVADIVGEPFAIHGDPPGGRDAAVRELLELVGLDPDHARRYPHQFSGGQRQRIGIARAIALRPRILVCDEPVSALDVSIQGKVINLLEDLQDELGLSYLFIAHDLGVVRHIADEVAVMYLGRVVEQGTCPDVYEDAQHPYTQALLSAVPEPDPRVRLVGPGADTTGGGDIVLEGDPPSPMTPPSGCPFHTRCWLAPTVETNETAVRIAAAGADGARQVPSSCSAEVPVLEVRGTGPSDDGGATGPSPHQAACHFARTLAPADTTPGSSQQGPG